MKVLNLHAKATVEIKLPEDKIKELPQEIGLVTTIQHLDLLDTVAAQLTNSVKGGQVLGCDTNSAEKINNQVEAFLFIGSGQFHPIAIALKTKKPVFCWNPFTKELKKIDENEIKRYEQKKKASLTKFLSSNKIGILVSTKPGQNNMKKALELKEKNDKLQQEDSQKKEYYIFQFDTLNPSELENFPFIECWVNTACPRIADEKVSIVNISDL